MRKLEIDSKTYWAGMHQVIGVVVFDQDVQNSVGEERVRLWVDSEKRMATFLNNLVKPLIPPNLETSDDELGHAVDSYLDHRAALEQAMRAYAQMKAEARSTHCYNCKSDLNSVDFSLCTTCKWIRCTCSACGCGYRRF